MSKWFSKKYRIVEITKGKIKTYYPQSGRFFYSYYRKNYADGTQYSILCFSSEELARTFIKDRMLEDGAGHRRIISVE